MRKRAVLVLLFLSLAFINLQSVNAASETFQLIQVAYIVKVLELQTGDCLEGSFNVSTLYSYRSSFDNRIYTYWVAVDAFDPESNVIVDFPEIDDQHLYQLNFGANSSGRYEVRFICGYNFFPPEAIVPQVTFHYNITSSAQPTSTAQPSASSMNEAYSTAGYFLFTSLIVILIVALLLYVKRRGKTRVKNRVSGGDELPFMQ